MYLLGHGHLCHKDPDAQDRPDVTWWQKHQISGHYIPMLYICRTLFGPGLINAWIIRN
jgi:hypothetical protein